MKTKLLNIALLLIVLVTPVSGFAYDGQVVGQIDQIEGASSAAGGFPFVVTFINSPALCGNSNTSAYLLNTDANYRLNASILITAKSLGSTVTLSSNRDANGACQIIAISIR